MSYIINICYAGPINKILIIIMIIKILYANKTIRCIREVIYIYIYIYIYIILNLPGYIKI